MARQRPTRGPGCGCWTVVVGVTLAAVGLVAVLFVAVRWIDRRAGSAAPPVTEETGPPGAAASEPGRPPARPPAGRPASRPDSQALAAARRHLGQPLRETGCGGYRLLTDLAVARIAPICSRAVAGLDEAYAALYGVAPVGRPAEAVLLFADEGSFRRFVSDDGGAAGYAGYAVGARGFAALAAGARSDDELASTLIHELTHLVSRRALGPDLPPWLSEGLADGVGDAATAAGLAEPRGFDGVGFQVERLRGAYRLGRAASLERLVALRWGEFDARTVSFDYEQSALLVRFLLAEEDLAPRFRGYLATLAGGERYDPAALGRRLGSSWSELDERFRTWIEGPESRFGAVNGAVR